MSSSNCVSRKIIIVRNRFEGLHCWPDAPEDVSFLRYPHRHLFYAKVGVRVQTDNREVEFFTLQREIQAVLNTFPYDLGSRSCEQVALSIFESLWDGYNIVFIEVLEDDENGARIEWA